MPAEHGGERGYPGIGFGGRGGGVQYVCGDGCGGEGGSGGDRSGASGATGGGDRGDRVCGADRPGAVGRAAGGDAGVGEFGEAFGGGLGGDGVDGGGYPAGLGGIGRWKFSGIEGGLGLSWMCSRGVTIRARSASFRRGRGPNRSVPLAGVVGQVRRLVEGGVREVVLTGVDLASWDEGLGVLVRGSVAGGAGVGAVAIKFGRSGSVG